MCHIDCVKETHTMMYYYQLGSHSNFKSLGNIYRCTSNFIPVKSKYFLSMPRHHFYPRDTSLNETKILIKLALTMVWCSANAGAIDKTPNFTVAKRMRHVKHSKEVFWNRGLKKVPVIF